MWGWGRGGVMFQVMWNGPLWVDSGHRGGGGEGGGGGWSGAKKEESE